MNEFKSKNLFDSHGAVDYLKGDHPEEDDGRHLESGDMLEITWPDGKAEKLKCYVISTEMRDDSYDEHAFVITQYHGAKVKISLREMKHNNVSIKRVVK